MTGQRRSNNGAGVSLPRIGNENCGKYLGNKLIPWAHLLKSIIHYLSLVEGCIESSGTLVNTIALRKAKIVCNYGLSECNRVNI